MRIAQVIYALKSGGAEQLVSDLSLTLAGRGHSVHLILVDRWDEEPFQQSRRNDLSEAGVQLHCLDREPGTAGIASAIRLHRLMREFRFDVVHSHLAIPDAMVRSCRLLGCRNAVQISTVHSVRDTRPWYLKLASYGRHVVYCSEAARRENSAENSRAMVIPNGARLRSPSTSNHSTLATRHRLGIDSGIKVILSVGNLRPEKNYGCALQALSLFKSTNDQSFQYLICGQGPDQNELIDRARRLGLENQLRLLGARTDVQNLLLAADVFINVSLYEGLPIAALEALSSGLPCVFPPLPELVDLAGQMEACVFAETHSASAFATAIRQAINIPTSRQQIAERRNPLLSPYSIERCADDYLELYSELAASDGRGAVEKPSLDLRLPRSPRA